MALTPLSKFVIFNTVLPLKGDSFARFLRNYQLLYSFIGSLHVLNLVAFGDGQPSYKRFPAMVAFIRKFSVAPSSETTDRIRKS